jgi:hypothetical protein
VLVVSLQLFLERNGLASFAIFAPMGRRLEGTGTAGAPGTGS